MNDLFVGALLLIAASAILIVLWSVFKALHKRSCECDWCDSKDAETVTHCLCQSCQKKLYICDDPTKPPHLLPGQGRRRIRGIVWGIDKYF